MRAQPVVLHTRVVTETGGGPDKTILNSPRVLRELGYDAICAYMRHPEDAGFHEIEKRAEKWQAPLVAVDDHGPLDWRVPARFRDVCAEHHPAIWHGHDYKSNLMGLLVGRGHPMALITTVHGWVKKTWKTPLYYAIDRYCLRRYDHVICVSEDILRDCISLGIPEDRCGYLPNAIDTREFHRSESARAALVERARTPERLVVGAAGRLSREKGFANLIRAVRQMSSDGLDIELRIAGDGDARAELEALSERCGLRNRVKFLGFVSDTTAFYEHLDCLVISSLREGLPNVLLEAMAFELPVVSTRSGGISTVLTDLENGVLLDQGTPQEIAQALSSLAEDPQMRLRLGKEARATVERSFSFRRRMDTMSRIYDRVLT